jgi:hypothetical protein
MNALFKKCIRKELNILKLSDIIVAYKWKWTQLLLGICYTCTPRLICE